MVSVFVLGECDALDTGLHEPSEGSVQQIHGTGLGVEGRKGSSNRTNNTHTWSSRIGTTPLIAVI